MPRSAAEVRQCLRLRLHEMIATAMRADAHALNTLLAGLQSQADRREIDFLRRARQVVLGSTVALLSVAVAHGRVAGPHGTDICRTCGTTGVCRTVRRIADTLAAYPSGPVVLDRAEAWRRADLVLDAAQRELLVGVEEIPDGYVTWAIPAAYSGRDRPAPSDDGVVIVDSTATG